MGIHRPTSHLIHQHSPRECGSPIPSSEDCEGDAHYPQGCMGWTLPALQEMGNTKNPHCCNQEQAGEVQVPVECLCERYHPRKRKKKQGKEVFKLPPSLDQSPLTPTWRDRYNIPWVFKGVVAPPLTAAPSPTWTAVAEPLADMAQLSAGMLPLGRGHTPGPKEQTPLLLWMKNKQRLEKEKRPQNLPPMQW